MTQAHLLLNSSCEQIDTEAEIDRLAARYKAASGLGIEVLNILGSQAEGLIEQLPKGARNGLEATTEAALHQAMRAAHGSRRFVPGASAPWLQSAMAASLGAVGGAGGVTTALAELPVTVSLLLRIIQDVAAKEGFDPASENVKFDCVQVFAAAGPLAKDDGADLAFVSTRLALTGGAMQALIARIAPRLAVVLGQKLAAQAVPVLGALAGAATNYAYTSYYREVAGVHFGLRRLAIDADRDHTELVAGLRARLEPEAMPGPGASPGA